MSRYNNYNRNNTGEKAKVAFFVVFCVYLPIAGIIYVYNNYEMIWEYIKNFFGK